MRCSGSRHVVRSGRCGRLELASLPTTSFAHALSSISISTAEVQAVARRTSWTWTGSSTATLTHPLFKATHSAKLMRTTLTFHVQCFIPFNW